MPKRTRGIRKLDARVLLSDVLPYELPPSFDNRAFYDFVQANRLKFPSGGPQGYASDDGDRAILSAIFGPGLQYRRQGSRVQIDNANQNFESYSATVPFRFSIRHGANDFRTLAVPHPAAQLKIVDFYYSNAALILYYTAKSKYSLRRPHRVARYSVIRDWLFERARAQQPDSIEEDPREYRWLRSYFAYRRYSNIYKFYDSPQYQEYERKYSFLIRLDVAKCFDSIYTHSIAWAAEGYDVTKSNISHKSNRPKGARQSFGGEFDLLMQRLNHNETSGIVIGPEVSRVFAEIIMQAIDCDIENQLAKLGLSLDSDYAILRYVDDYFVFLANADKRDLVASIVSQCLGKYKLHLNSLKEQGEYTPWTSPLSIAKLRLTQLIQEQILLGEPDASSRQSLPRPFVRSRALIIGYKSILLDTGVSHFDLANYALLQCERRLETVMRHSARHLNGISIGDADAIAHTSRLTTALLFLLDFVFFVYSASPRMSPTIKIARIVSTILRFAKSTHTSSHDRERLEMRIRSELVQQLQRGSSPGDPDVVTATLIDCLTGLGEPYRGSQDDLAQWCGFSRLDIGFRVPDSMNVLLLLSLLLHMRGGSGYAELRTECLRWAMQTQGRPASDGERAIVALNLLTCPWIPSEFRAAIVAANGGAAANKSWRSRGLRKWNVDWTGFDLYDALQAKRVYEVY